MEATSLSSRFCITYNKSFLQNNKNIDSTSVIDNAGMNKKRTIERKKVARKRHKTKTKFRKYLDFKRI